MPLEDKASDAGVLASGDKGGDGGNGSTFSIAVSVDDWIRNDRAVSGQNSMRLGSVEENSRAVRDAADGAGIPGLPFWSLSGPSGRWSNSSTTTTPNRSNPRPAGNVVAAW